MKISEYLIQAIQETGTKHVFGIQGDYILNFYDQLSKSPLKLINTCDEQGAGFAADAYARMSGFGVACVTYGVGGLKLVNSTAQAFAEMSPVLVISGAPGMSERCHDPLLHHKVRSFETQLNVFKEMTVAQALLSNAKTAAKEIYRVIRAIQESKRPGYIELPRDMVQVEAADFKIPASKKKVLNQLALDKALREIISRLSRAKKPMIIAGMEIHRFGLQNLLLKFIEDSGFPFVTGLLSKSVLLEDHPQFIGVYAGAMSPELVQKQVEESDCIIAFGPLISDFSTGIFHYNINLNNLVVVFSDHIQVKQKKYPGINIEDCLCALNEALPKIKRSNWKPAPYRVPDFVPVSDQKITMRSLIAAVNQFMDKDVVVIADTGDAMFGGMDLHVHGTSSFISPAYYASTGFAVPAALGAQLACSNKRLLVFEGDGSFQMTGMEISTAARLGLNPIVIVLNNGGYGTFRPMVDGNFNDLQAWQYAEITKIIGAGKGYMVATEGELVLALENAKKDKSSLVIIDVHLDKKDFSFRSSQLTSHLKKRVK